MKKTVLLSAVILLLIATLAAQTVTVMSPNGGEPPWMINTSHNITWTFTNPGSVKVDIILRNSGGKVGVIKSQVVLSAGTFLWNVDKLENGTKVVPGTDYRIRIRNKANTVTDDSNNAFAIGSPQPVIITVPHREPIPPSILKFPRIEVSGIDLAPNAEGFAIIFSYKNAGAVPWPKASEVPVKPNYRVFLGTTETTKGSLFIPAFPAPPGWEQWGYFGGHVVFPDSPANIYDVDNKFFEHTGGFGREVEVVINENKVMGMSSHQLIRKLEPMAYKYYYDLIVEKVWYVWNTHMLNIVLKVEGKIPTNGKFDLVCKTSVSYNNVFQPEQRRFHITQAMDNRFYSFSKKVDLPSDCDQVKFIVYAIGNCDGNQQQKVCDFDMGNNRMILTCRQGEGCSSY